MIIFSCSLWQEGFERGKCSSDTMGNHNKVTFILSGGICLTFCGMIVTYACVQNTNLATTVSLTELQKYLRTIPAQMGMLKCYMFF